MCVQIRINKYIAALNGMQLRTGDRYTGTLIARFARRHGALRQMPSQFRVHRHASCAQYVAAGPTVMLKNQIANEMEIRIRGVLRVRYTCRMYLFVEGIKRGGTSTFLHISRRFPF